MTYVKKRVWFLLITSIIT